MAFLIALMMCEIVRQMIISAAKITIGAPAKNMKNSSVALNKFLTTTPPELSKGISVL